MQICTLLTRIQCKVSDTQVTFKACGPLVIYSMMWLLICEYEPFWQEVSVKSLIFRWPLRPVGLLFNILFSTVDRQTKCIVKMSTEGHTNIVNFLTSRVGVVELCKILIMSISIYSTLIAIVSRDMMQLSLPLLNYLLKAFYILIQAYRTKHKSLSRKKRIAEKQKRRKWRAVWIVLCILVIKK